MDITAQRAASAAIWVIDTRESLGMPVMLNFVGASPANSDIFICDKRGSYARHKTHIVYNAHAYYFHSEKSRSQRRSESAANTALIPHIITRLESFSSSFKSSPDFAPMLPPSCKAAPSRPAEPPVRWVSTVPRKMRRHKQRHFDVSTNRAYDKICTGLLVHLADTIAENDKQTCQRHKIQCPAMTLTEACGKVYRHMEQRADYSPYYTHCAGDKDPLCKGYGEFFHRPHFCFFINSLLIFLTPFYRKQRATYAARNI